MGNSNKTLIYLVDDDPMFMKALENDLQQNSKFAVKSFETGEAVLAGLTEIPDVIFLDYYLNSVEAKAMNGLQTLKKIKAIHPTLPVVILSSQDRIEVAVNCMRNDAFDYIVKSEAAFMRATNALKNLVRYKNLERDAKFYKRAGITTFVVVGLFIILFAVLSLFFPEVLKKYFSNPGWL